MFKNLLLMFTLLIGCAATSVKPSFAEGGLTYVSEAYTTIADLQFSIDGVLYTGLATVPHKVPRTFKFNIPKDTERLVIRTCHRSLTILNPKEGWYEWLYQQRYRLEDSGFCLMFVDVLSVKGTMKSAEIDFTDSNLQMEAFSTCNGVGNAKVTGATICQAPVIKTGLTQLIQMSEDVDAISKEGCAPMKCDMIYCYYIMSPGDCWFRMVGLKSGKKFRLVTRGYKEN
jgi:hypothetical protein